MLGTLTIIYTIRGGMRAVVWTEIVQASVYLIGGLSAIVLAGHSDERRVERDPRRGAAGGKAPS